MKLLFRTIIRHLKTGLYILSLVVVGFVVAVNTDTGLRYNYHHYVDDMLSIDVYQHYGIVGGAFHLFSTISGRLVSFLFSLLLTPFLMGGGKWMAALYTLNSAIFVFSLSFFLKSFFEKRYAVGLSTENSVLLSAGLYGIFYLFSFDKRYEFWYWFSATVVYEYSMVLMLLVLGLLMRERLSRPLSVIVLLASACLGFMAETHAAVMFLLVIGFTLVESGKRIEINSPKVRLRMGTAVLLLASLVLNYFSSGNASKMRITKTSLLSFESFYKAVLVLYNDWFCKWETVSVRAIPDVEFPAFFLRVFCVLLLVFLVFIFLKSLHFENEHKPAVNNAYLVLGVGAAIFIASYFMSAWLYANMADRIVDRCRFVGYFALFLGLFDFFVLWFMNRLRF